MIVLVLVLVVHLLLGVLVNQERVDVLVQELHRSPLDSSLLPKNELLACVVACLEEIVLASEDVKRVDFLDEGLESSWPLLPLVLDLPLLDEF